jgi:protocatechuate 3,4-dioxygenase, beta subunit
MIRRAFTVGLGAALAAPHAFATDLVATPAQTEGPFYPAAFPADSDNDLLQVRGQAARALGTVLHLQGRVLDSSGRPLDGAIVEIWQCDAQGLYDHPRQPGRERRDAAFQGYGKVLADAQSGYRFRTLKPVAYPGRTPHIHFAVLAPGTRRFITQMYVEGEPGNARDFLLNSVRDEVARRRLVVPLRPSGEEPGALQGRFEIVLPVAL